jgi:hypothetical protein
MNVSKIFDRDKLLNKRWLQAKHKPTQVDYWIVDEPAYIPVPGDRPNINVVPGDVLVWDGEYLFKVEGLEKFKSLYEL